MSKNYLFTSESVAEGHPDKVCDQISDAVLDEVIKQDRRARVACETYITMGLVIVGGEITTSGYIDIHKLVRRVLKDIGYNHHKYGFCSETCAIINTINTQSPDIAQGVDRGGAGDQGMMVGFACRETKEFMPLPILLAHKLARRISEVRKRGILNYLGPDGKSQVTVEYHDSKPKRLDAVVLACQHTEDILDSSGKNITKEAREEMIREIAIPVVGKWTDKKTKYYVNETGKFVVGGPQSDTGMTGRKIIVDTYGATVPVGGGAFSGKDPTKVDRSAAYMARYIAKNIVAARLADKCLVQLAYCIGRVDPVSIFVDTYNTGKISDAKLVNLIRKNFTLAPKGIIDELDLLQPIYQKTACYGHFGRDDVTFTWERLDKVKDLQKQI